ncbi:hypothetical protein C9374_010745 [Naegleria lovaniensis]|uniref:C2 domain-containing protein n=1 Tax=Naegleria lovaniensis TaxID=51637 RepID=A0AA88GHY3_NAELO|nr:uncharacterized protein C9374_010745 [Naegleria lovaniensis]KAG2374461.1 hypothetical protein C9374_010745 [Naegleria lovaniensis]
MGFTVTDRLELVIERASDLVAADLNGYSDPFVDIRVDNCLERRTQIMKKTLNPVWNETFVFYCIPTSGALKVDFELYDWDRFTPNDFIGRASLSIDSNCTEYNKSYPVTLTLKDIKSGTLKVSYKIKSSSTSNTNNASTSTTVGETNSFKIITTEFPSSFQPCVPKDFILVSSDSNSANKVYVAVLVNLSTGEVLTITYNDLLSTPFDTAAQVFLDVYLKGLKDGADKKSGKYELISRDLNVTHKINGNFSTVLESRCLTASSTTGRLLNCVCLTCGYPSGLMANYVWMTYDSVFSSEKYHLLVEVAKRTHVAK